MLSFSMQLTFTQQSDQAVRVLDNLRRALTDFTPALKKVEQLQKGTIEKQFASEGKETSSSWKPLAASTIKMRLQAGYSAGPILTASGRLRASFETFKLTRDTLIIGSRIPYFQYHQMGTEKMAQRPILNITQKLADEIGTEIQNYLINQAKNG